MWFFFFSSRRRHTRWTGDWSSDVCSSDLQTHFAAHDGMPHSFANAIAQTGDGYLWTTSQEGLSRFDGASFTTYDHRTTEGRSEERRVGKEGRSGGRPEH